jgi:hypothetical protein
VTTPDEQKAEQRKAEDKAERQRFINAVPRWKRTFFNIPVRPVTAKERAEQLLLAKAERDYLEGGDIGAFDERMNKLAAAQPAGPEDPLDRVRVTATLIMVAALFAIVAVIVFKKSPPSSLNQLVSLASGLAGIGLGWLFGAATTRSRRGT